MYFMYLSVVPRGRIAGSSDINSYKAFCIAKSRSKNVIICTLTSYQCVCACLMIPLLVGSITHFFIILNLKSQKHFIFLLAVLILIICWPLFYFL